MRLPPMASYQASNSTAPNSLPSTHQPSQQQRLPGFQSLLHTDDRIRPRLPPPSAAYMNGRPPNFNSSAASHTTSQQQHTMGINQRRTLTPDASPPQIKRSDSYPARHQSSMEWAYSRGSQNLPTPPRSHEFKPSDNFNDHQDDSDALFKRKQHSRHSSASSLKPLFGPHDSSAAGAAAHPGGLSMKPEAQWSANWTPEQAAQPTLPDLDDDEPNQKRRKFTVVEPSTSTSIEIHIDNVKNNLMWRNRGVSPPHQEHYEQFANFVTELSLRPAKSESGVPYPSQYSPMTTPRVHDIHLAGKRAEESPKSSRQSSKKASPGPVKLAANRVGMKRAGSSQGASSKPSGAERKAERAKSSKIIFDKDFSNYPDFTPSMDLAVDPWKHARISKDWDPAKNDAKLEALKEDPLSQHMTDFELELARALSLKCGQYLLVKRQIFCKFIEWLQKKHSGHPKPGNWNKTAAQEASNVDVNKTSKLFEFYQSTGLFNEEHHHQHLHPSP